MVQRFAFLDVLQFARMAARGRAHVRVPALVGQEGIGEKEGPGACDLWAGGRAGGEGGSVLVGAGR